MKKKLITGLMVLSLFFLSACGKGTTVPPPSGEDVSYPLTLTDQTGRTVTIPKKPERIVSGYYITTSTLIALGVKDRICGIEEKAGKRNIYRLSAPELLELKNVGSAKNLDIEACVSLQPDLVILPAKVQKAAETLSDLGIPVILVEPETGDAAEEMITLLGKAVSAEPKAQELISYIHRVREKLAARPGEKVRVYLSGNSGFLKTAGAKMYQAEMIRESGNENAAEALEESYWAEVGYEQILVWNPELILLASEAVYTVDDVLNDPALKGVKAIENKRVYAMPSDLEAWDSPVPGAVLGSLYLSSLTGGVTEEEYRASVKEFYETFYGFTPESF